MVQHVGAGAKDEIEGIGVALAVRDQDLDRRRRPPAANGFDRRRERGRPAVHEVVARHRGDHRVLETHACHRLGHVFGLVGVKGERLTGVDQAEPARTRAAVAVEHERGGAVGPALEDVRAARLLAHRHQVELAHGLLEREIARPDLHLGPQPPRLPLGDL